MDNIEKIRTLRLLKGYSQEYMAIRLNVSQSFYSRLELGKCKMSVDHLKSIARILEVETEDLLRLGDEEMDEMKEQLRSLQEDVRFLRLAIKKIILQQKGRLFLPKWEEANPELFDS